MKKQGYGIPYAMAVHDIERLEEVPDIREVNQRMRDDGWVLLYIGQYADTDTFLLSGEPIHNSCAQFIMGVPRPQFCTMLYYEPHPPNILKLWYHEQKRWQCPHCDEIYARAHKTDETPIPF